MRYVLLLLFLSGCSTLTDFFLPAAMNKNPKVEWRKDLLLEVDDKIYRGVALVPIKTTYSITIWPSDERIDRLQWRTCHREDYVDKAVKRGFWPWSKDDKFFKMSFTPKRIELDRACPLMLEALAEKHKSMSFGMVIFPDANTHVSLPAIIECDGRTERSTGVSECQGAVDTIHKINFDGEVFQDDRPNATCPPMKQVKSNSFEFFMPKDLCVYLFKSPQKDANGKYKTHKLITFGYEQIPPPKGV